MNYFSKDIYLVRSWIGYLQISLELKQSFLCTASRKCNIYTSEEKVGNSYYPVCFKFSSLFTFLQIFKILYYLVHKLALSKKEHLKWSLLNLYGKYHNYSITILKKWRNHKTNGHWRLSYFFSKGRIKFKHTNLNQLLSFLYVCVHLKKNSMFPLIFIDPNIS